MQMVNKLNYLFPQPCLCCGLPASDTGICRPCTKDLPWQHHACRQCALPLIDSKSPLCGQCLRKPPPFIQSFTPWTYDFPISQLINRFKHHGDLTCGKQLARLMANSIGNHYQDKMMPELLVPTPLHWRRFITRGFNQSQIIASELSTRLAIPLAIGARRIKATTQQQDLDRKTRHKNLKDAFVYKTSLNQKTVAIIDDVMTTGATAHALAECLLNAGVEQVHLWCLARTDE